MCEKPPEKHQEDSQAGLEGLTGRAEVRGEKSARWLSPKHALNTMGLWCPPKTWALQDNSVKVHSFGGDRILKRSTRAGMFWKHKVINRIRTEPKFLNGWEDELK